MPKMLRYTLPIVASGLLQLLFNAADIIVVGKFAGDVALAAVGSNTSLVMLLLNLFIGLSIGVNVMAARYYGAKEQENLTRTVNTAIAAAIISGIALTIIGCFGAGLFLKWMATPETVLKPATLYLRIFFGGMIANMVYNFGAALLRAIGDTRRPLYFLAGAGVINVCLNLIFVIVFRMSVAGVALATVISQCISAGLVVRCLVKENGAVHLDIRNMRPDPVIFMAILRIGLPASVQSLMFSISNVTIQACINSFGDVIMAGNAAAGNIEGFVYVGMNGFAQSVLSFTGQNVGAGRRDRLIPILIRAEICVIITGLILGEGVVFFSAPLLGLYSDSAQVIAAGMLRTHVVALTYFLCGIMDVIVGFLRGLGYSVMPMIVSLTGVCGLRMLWIFTLFRIPEFHTITWLYRTYPFTWIVTILCYVISLIVIRKKEFVMHPSAIH